MRLLITGSSGLVGGECVEYFDRQGHEIIGIDNNMRAFFFGEAGDTTWNLDRIRHKTTCFRHEAVDIRDFAALEDVFLRRGPFDAVVHAAAQPSHDKAREIPLVDFQVNAVGTLNLLELTRQSNPRATFVFLSTNKVYGDEPNSIPRVEWSTRFHYAMSGQGLCVARGINEDMSIDRSTHSLFGASKAAADLMVQEYGRSFAMNTACLRGGCLTGPHHSGVELHGFLQYLAKCVLEGKPYTVFGYGGKQVRDNLHSFDVVKAIEAILHEPRPAAVYNLGGGRENSVSVLEAIQKLEELTSRKLDVTFSNFARLGDHVCYITDMTRFKADYPAWRVTKDLDRILLEIVGAMNRGKATERFWPGDGGDSYFEAYSRALLPLVKGRVLDIGCGHGFLTRRIACKEEVEVVLGTDRHNGWRDRHPKAEYMIVDTATMITCPGSWDTIISTEHVEHLDAELQDRLLVWVKESLMPGGQFLGSMPYPDDPKNPSPFHLATCGPEVWEQKLHEHFKDVQIWDVCEGCYCWKCG